jgi:hypothetical protein
MLNINYIGYTMSLNQYTIYCITESQFVTGYAYNPITTCPNNPTHTVNPDSVSLVPPTKATTVQLATVAIPTNGNVITRGYAWSNLPPGPSNLDIQWAYPTNTIAFNGQFSQASDSLDVVIAPNNDLGAGSVTADTTVGQTQFTMRASDIANLYIGLEMLLYSATTVDFLGQIIMLDTVANTITIATAPVNAYSASTAVFKTNRYIVRDFVCGIPTVHAFTMKSGAEYIPANTILRFCYNNSSPTANVNFNISLQYEF